MAGDVAYHSIKSSRTSDQHGSRSLISSKYYEKQNIWRAHPLAATWFPCQWMCSSYLRYVLTPLNALTRYPIFRGITNAFKSGHQTRPIPISQHPSHLHNCLTVSIMASYSAYSPSASKSSCSTNLKSSASGTSSSSSSLAVSTRPIRPVARVVAVLPAAASFATASHASIQSA